MADYRYLPLLLSLSSLICGGSSTSAPFNTSGHYCESVSLRNFTRTNYTALYLSNSTSYVPNPSSTSTSASLADRPSIKTLSVSVPPSAIYSPQPWVDIDRRSVLRPSSTSTPSGLADQPSVMIIDMPVLSPWVHVSDPSVQATVGGQSTAPTNIPSSASLASTSASQADQSFTEIADVLVSSSLPTSSESLIQVTVDGHSTAPTNTSSPTSSLSASPSKTLVGETKATPDVSGTSPALPIDTSYKFQHTTAPFWPLTTSSRNLAVGNSKKSVANSSSLFAQQGTDFSVTASSNESPTGRSSAVTRSPTLNLSTPKSRNISSLRPPFMNFTPSVYKETFSSFSNASQTSNQTLVTSLFNISTPLGLRRNRSFYPPFANSSTNVLNTSINISSPVPTALFIHNSSDNSDLYPPRDLSRATKKPDCPPMKTSEAFNSPMNATESGTPGSGHQGDLYPPLEIACRAGEAAFFEFSEENIRKSEVIDWYARWTIEAREKYFEKLISLGEWRLFYRWWLLEYDFRCGYDFKGCLNAKNREDIQKIYPGEENRNLVRKIYFVTLMYEYLHQHTHMMEVGANVPCPTDFD